MRVSSLEDTRVRRPVAGDLLVSERTARADVYVVTVVPSPAIVAVLARHAEAIAKVREMARGLGVDGWYTCDHTHYARVAKRRGAEAREPATA